MNKNDTKNWLEQAHASALSDLVEGDDLLGYAWEVDSTAPVK